MHKLLATWVCSSDSKIKENFIYKSYVAHGTYGKTVTAY